MKRLNGLKTKLVLVVVVAAMVVDAEIANADGIWRQKADMPTTRYQLSTSVVHGKIYAIGGWGPQDALTRVDEYNPVTDTWTKKADMPTARGFTSTNVVNEMIYVISGDSSGIVSGISAVEVYDPTTDTWAERTEHPTQRRWHSTSVVDGIIYVIGGAVRNESEGRTYHFGTVEAYDPSTDTWAPKADMPTGRSFLSTCVVDGIIYAIGGFPSAANYVAPVEAYDPGTDTWTKKGDMPTARYLLDTVVVDGKIYAIGGYHHSIQGPIYSTVEVYDPETDIWTKGVDIPVPTAGLSTSVVDGKIYVIGGTLAPHNPNFIDTSSVYEYDSIVDFNGDGIVDSADMCIMIDHWGENYSLCDIGPTPWGDGIVDVQDLIVLSEHLFEEVNDPTLIAHWAFDEIEGMFAVDSAGDNDAFVVGGASWQPGSGQVDGALQLNGVDGCAIAGPVLIPADGPFSLLAWINGGAPGQVVISQQGAANWLATDAEGNLMTELKCTGRSAGPLYSETVITDGQWHRVGLVWNGSHRKLFIDGVTVAEDAQPGLEGSQMGLYIGTGKAMESGTFFSGLIDDVRIYNRAVSL